MDNTIETAAVESLRAFALSQCVASCHPHDYANNDVFRRFADMCTAALQGEQWAVERVAETIMWATPVAGDDADQMTLRSIRAMNSTRPHDAVARGGIAP